MKHNRANLTTEKRNRKSRNIDSLPTLEIVNVINSQDMLVVPAVRKERRTIAAAVDMITQRLRNGGRLFYVVQALAAGLVFWMPRNVRQPMV